MARSIRNTQVAVVGGAGFLGSHLVNHLIDDRGCEVLVVDNLCAGRRQFIHQKANFLHHDITTSEEFLLGAFVAHRIEYVFNYAAYPYIPVSFERPLHVFNVNANGAIKVINAAQEAGCKGIIQVSSAEIYGEHRGNWDGDPSESKLDESAPIIPHSTYGAAKAAVDYYCQCAWRERKTPVIALRQFNCVGERETHPYVIPEIIGQLSKHLTTYNPQLSTTRLLTSEELGRHKPTIQLGNNSVRDFMYAGDAVRIAVELLERGGFGEVYNLGSEEGIKIYDLAKRIGKLMGFADVQVEEDPARKRPWEIWNLLASNEKINTILVNRPPLVSLDESLTRTIRWYEENGRMWSWEK